MIIDTMLNEHERAQYEGPDAVICSACGDVVRKRLDSHECPSERRGPLQRRIYKGEMVLNYDPSRPSRDGTLSAPPLLFRPELGRRFTMKEWRWGGQRVERRHHDRRT